MKRILPVAICCALLSLPLSAAAVPVDLELSLLVDISGSVDAGEFALQRGGYVSAFNSPTIATAISQGAVGSIAVNLIYWSGASQQYVGVPWTLIDGTAGNTAADFATLVSNANRPTPYNLTAPGSAINYATPLFASNGFDGTRQVIDVSGDGTQNDGASTSGARNSALAAGVDQINGLAIGSAALATWYTNNIQGGSGSFVASVSNFADFAAAIDDKLVREIQGVVPEPGTMILLGSGLLGLAGVQRRRKQG